MAQSSQDMEDFLDQEIEIKEPLPTRIELVPDCEVRASVVSITPRKRFDGNDNEWKALVEVMFSINDPEIKEETGLDDPRAKLTIFLDTVKGWDGRGYPPLAFGRNKNVRMGQVLEGFGVNNPRKFKWSTLMHEDAWIRVTKPNDNLSPFSNVAAVGMNKDDVQTAASRRREKATAA